MAGTGVILTAVFVPVFSITTLFHIFLLEVVGYQGVRAIALWARARGAVGPLCSWNQKFVPVRHWILTPIAATMAIVPPLFVVVLWGILVASLVDVIAGLTIAFGGASIFIAFLGLRRWAHMAWMTSNYTAACFALSLTSYAILLLCVVLIQDPFSVVGATCVFMTVNFLLVTTAVLASAPRLKFKQFIDQLDTENDSNTSKEDVTESSGQSSKSNLGMKRASRWLDMVKRHGSALGIYLLSLCVLVIYGGTINALNSGTKSIGWLVAGVVVGVDIILGMEASLGNVSSSSEPLLLALLCRAAVSAGGETWWFVALSGYYIILATILPAPTLEMLYPCEDEASALVRKYERKAHTSRWLRRQGGVGVDIFMYITTAGLFIILTILVAHGAIHNPKVTIFGAEYESFHFGIAGILANACLMAIICLHKCLSMFRVRGSLWTFWGLIAVAAHAAAMWLLVTGCSFALYGVTQSNLVLGIAIFAPTSITIILLSWHWWQVHGFRICISPTHIRRLLRQISMARSEVANRGLIPESHEGGGGNLKVLGICVCGGSPEDSDNDDVVNEDGGGDNDIAPDADEDDESKQSPKLVRKLSSLIMGRKPPTAASFKVNLEDKDQKVEVAYPESDHESDSAPLVVANVNPITAYAFAICSVVGAISFLIGVIVLGAYFVGWGLLYIFLLTPSTAGLYFGLGGLSILTLTAAIIQAVVSNRMTWPSIGLIVVSALLFLLMDVILVSAFLTTYTSAERGVIFVAALLGYAIIVLKIISIVQWRIMKWRVSFAVLSSFMISTTGSVLVGILIAVFFSVPWGLGIISIETIFVFGVVSSISHQFLRGAALTWSDVAAVLVTLVCIVALGVIIAVEAGGSLASLSVGWLSVCVCLGAFCIINLQESKHERIIFGPRLFPCYQYNTKTNTMSSRTGYLGGLCVALLMWMLWSFAAVIGLSNKEVGLAAMSIGLLGAVHYAFSKLYKLKFEILKTKEYIDKDMIADLKAKASTPQNHSKPSAGDDENPVGQDELSNHSGDHGDEDDNLSMTDRFLTLNEEANGIWRKICNSGSYEVAIEGARNWSRIDRQRRKAFKEYTKFFARLEILVALAAKYNKREFEEELLEFLQSKEREKLSPGDEDTVEDGKPVPPGTVPSARSIDTGPADGQQPAPTEPRQSQDIEKAGHVEPGHAQPEITLNDIKARVKERRHQRNLRLKIMEGDSSVAHSKNDKRSRVNICPSVIPLMSEEDSENANTKFDAILRQQKEKSGKPRSEAALYEDPDFVPSDVFLRGPGLTVPASDWAHGVKLPHRGGKAAVLFEDGATPCDIRQGALGDCWFLAAMANLASIPGLIEGLFIRGDEGLTWSLHMVKLFAAGAPWAIILDDRLPAYKSHTIVYGRSTTDHELWVSLLEKAAAKLFGEYQSLVSGSPALGMHYLTGYDYTFTLHSSSSEDVATGNLWSNMLRWMEYGFKVAAGSKGEGDDSDKEHVMGIRKRHAYSVLQAREIHGFQLLQLRNPWGHSEWTGPWSDGDVHWAKYPEVARELKYVKKDDGSFWMPYTYYLRHFESSEVLLYSPSPAWSYVEPVVISGISERHKRIYRVNIELKKSTFVGFEISQPEREDLDNPDSGTTAYIMHTKSLRGGVNNDVPGQVFKSTNDSRGMPVVLFKYFEAGTYTIKFRQQGTMALQLPIRVRAKLRTSETKVITMEPEVQNQTLGGMPKGMASHDVSLSKPDNVSSLSPAPAAAAAAAAAAPPPQ